MYKQENVLIQGETTIAATITTPDQERSSFPAIVLIGGTGGLDRDGNGTGFKSNLYKDLAEWLTIQGFITLRYDKRGIENNIVHNSMNRSILSYSINFTTG